jgi:drug/metabolite transporter (DMT)-like permease
VEKPGGTAGSNSVVPPDGYPMTANRGHNSGISSQNSHAEGTEKLAAHFAMLLFAVLIAGSFSLGHQAAPYIGAAALNAVRFTIATGLLSGIVMAMSWGRLPLPVAIWRYAILGGLMAIYFILMFVALKLTDPVSTGAVFTLVPLMSAGFGWLFLRQSTRPVVLLASAIAACGAIWVIFQADIQAIMSFRIGPGPLIFFVGCAAHAAYVPLVRKFRRDETVAVFTVWTLVASTIWIAIFGTRQLASTDFAQLPASVWVAIAYLAVFTTAGTFYLVQFASVRLPASKVLAYGYLTPAFIVVIEGMSGHGWVTPGVFAGAAVTATALLVMALAPDS